MKVSTMEKIYCHECGSKRVILGLYITYLNTPGIAGICDCCGVRVPMPEYDLEVFIIEDLEDYGRFNYEVPNEHRLEVAMKYPIEELVELDSDGKGNSFCCTGKYSLSKLGDKNLVKCYQCRTVYSPLGIIKWQEGIEDGSVAVDILIERFRAAMKLAERNL